jgi:hypothetical protein
MTRSGGLSGGYDALKYSIKASRSPGSTKAPHLIILSTSFVQLLALKRCCRMMLASLDGEVRFEIRHLPRDSCGLICSRSPVSRNAESNIFGPIFV